MSFPPLPFVCSNIVFLPQIVEDDDQLLKQIQGSLNSHHSGHYKVFNFDSSWQSNNGFQDMDHFWFDCQCPCPLEMIIQFCSSMEFFMSKSPKEVVALYGGEDDGRKVSMCACFLLHLGSCITYRDCVTHLDKLFPYTESLTRSQIRYIKYYEHLLRENELESNTFQITGIRMVTIPAFDSSIIDSGCSPRVEVSVQAKLGGLDEESQVWKSSTVFSQDLKTVTHLKCKKHSDYIFELDRYNIQVRGDICVSLFHENEKMCEVRFHGAFVEGNYLSFEKSVIDFASSDHDHRLFPQGFRLEIFLHRIVDNPKINIFTLKQ